MKVRQSILCVATSMLVLSGSVTPVNAQDEGAQRVSRPGQYEGYSPTIYDGTQLTSIYVPVRDGTRIAVDIIRPTLGGEVVTDPLPVLWMHTPYNRRARGGPSAAEAYPSGPISLVQHGYVVAVADYRGLYGSFGVNDLYNLGAFVEPASSDAYDITEWLADQPWSSGNIGMWGCSATGGSQLQAASTMPPSLKAMFVLSPNFDTYEFFNPGGIPNNVPLPPGTPATPLPVAERDQQASPVDGPDGDALLAEAHAEHRDMVHNAFFVTDLNVPYRDSVHPELGAWWHVSSPSSMVDAIRQSGVAIYSGANYEEAGTKTAPVMVYANTPDDRGKLILGPHGHCAWGPVEDSTGMSINTEQLRFFDHWLKGVDNGVMEEPAVTYYTYNAPEGMEWQQAADWPLPEERPMTLYLADGGLSAWPGDGASKSVPFGAPTLTTPGSMRLPDPVSLTFETAPLERAMQVTGNPLLRLWIESTAGDADVSARLVDVAPDGTTRSYGMVGQLRASHRAMGAPAYDTMDLPYHTHREGDAQPLVPDTPVELQFGIAPMSYIFPVGHRIRLELAFADPARGDGEVTLLTGGEHGSSLTLPVIPTE